MVKAFSEVPALLREVVTRTSSASAALLGQLLQLLVDAAETVLQSSPRDAANAEGEMPLGTILKSHDLQWVLALLSASLSDAGELHLLDGAGRRGVLEEALAAATSPLAAEEAVPLAGCLAPPTGVCVGDEVWARCPASRQWYRARLLACVHAHVEVAWLAAPLAAEAQEGAAEGHYRGPSAAGERLWLSGAAVAPACCERPAAAAACAGEAALEKHLKAAEMLGRSRRQLQALIQESNAQNMEGASPTVSSLRGTAGSLEALRKEGERRAEVLAGVAANCALEGMTCEQELTRCSKGFEDELVTVKQEQEVLRCRAAALQREREELAAKLWALDEELATASAALAKVGQRERELRKDTETAAHELLWEMSTGEEAGRKVAQQRRFLIEVAAVSRDVEALLATRAQEARAVGSAGVEFCGRRLPEADAYLQCELLHLQHVEELCAGLRAAMSGPELHALLKGGAGLARVQQLHERALVLLDQAGRGLAQLLRQCELSEALDGAGKVGEVLPGCFARAAARYQEMHGEVLASLERLADLQLPALGPSPVPVDLRLPAVAA